MKELQEVIIPDQFVFIRDKPPSTIARADTPCLIELVFGANLDMRGPLEDDHNPDEVVVGNA